MRSKTLVPLIVGIILIILFIPEFWGGKIYFNGDMLFGFYPTLFFYKQQLLNHQSFLWMRGILGGFPIYLDPSGGFYSPIHLFLFKYFSVYTAYALALFVATGFLFGLTYWCSRKMGISRPGSFLAALVYSFSYHILTWSNNLFVVNSLYSLPLLYLAITYISEGRWYWSIIGGLGIGFALFTGQPQWVLMSFVAGGFYVLYLLWLDSFRRSRKNGTLIVGFLMLGLIAGAVAAYQIIPINHFSALSSRAQGLSWSDAAINGQTPLDWIRYIVPEFGIQHLTTSEPIFYVGIVSLWFAIIGFSQFKKYKKLQLFSFLFLFGLITSLKFSPVFWLIHQLPFFNYFRGADRWMYIGNFGLALLAGFGFDSLRDGKITDNFLAKVQKWFGRILTFLVCITVLGNIIYYIFSVRLNYILEQLFDAYYYSKTKGGLSLEHYHDVIKATTSHLFSNLDILNWHFSLPLASLIAGYWLMVQWREEKSWVRRNLILISISLTAISLIPLNPNFNQIASRAILEVKPYFISIIEQHDNQNHQYRVFSVLGGSALDQKLRTPYFNSFTNDDVTQFYHDLIFPGMAPLYNVDSFEGLNNLMPQRMAAVLAFIGSEYTTDPSSLASENISFDEKLKDIVSRLPVFSEMNIKYLTSAYVLPPVPGLELIGQTTSTRFGIPIYLYENYNALPRVYLAKAVTFIPENSDAQAFESLKNQSSTSIINQNSLIECNHCLLPGPGALSDTLHTVEYQDGLLRLHASVKFGRWLIFSESRIPGWQATIDGNVVLTYYGDYVFQAIYIPAGEHDVQFQYERLPL